MIILIKSFPSKTHCTLIEVSRRFEVKHRFPLRTSFATCTVGLMHVLIHNCENGDITLIRMLAENCIGLYGGTPQETELHIVRVLFNNGILDTT
jgi:hypothetical protein